jgi:hypothetical protein
MSGVGNDPDFPDPTVWTWRYRVPRSQVFEGSKGGQQGYVHLHLPACLSITAYATIGPVRRTTIKRIGGQALCGIKRGWYERPGNPGETVCPRCVDYASRYGIDLDAIKQIGNAP